jgi:lipid A disaccharide synthetase
LYCGCKKRRKRKKKKKKYNKKCVFVLVFFYYVIKNKKKARKKTKKKQKNACLCLFQGSFYNEMAKHKEGFNILIGSRCRSTNLYESCISKFRRKDKIFKTSLTHHNHKAAYLR